MTVQPDPCRSTVVRSRSTRPRADRLLRLALAVGAAVGLAGSTAAVATAAVSEDFVDTPGPVQAWGTINRSEPHGPLVGWAFGNTGVFSAHQGAAGSYVAVSSMSTTEHGTISNWMSSPRLLLANGQTVSFFTRGTGSGYADRLELRLSTNGSCQPGTQAGVPGDFTQLLTTINPTLQAYGYPATWTQVSATLSGLPAEGATGCFGFHYSVPNGGTEGINSDYIGVDTFAFSGDYAPPPVPVLASFSPSSPANDNQPRVVGAADPATTVRIYANATCTGTPLASGSGDGLADGLAIAVANDASTTVYATATDERVSLTSACSSASPTYVEDSTAPATTDDVPSSWVAEPPTVTLAASDANGVVATHFAVGADPALPTVASPVYDPAAPPVLQDGERIRYFSVDAAGNDEALRISPVVRVDTTSPTTTDAITAETAPGQQAVLTAVDGQSGVAATHFTVGTDPALPTVASPVYDPADPPRLAAGERIRYFSVDEVGNSEAPRSSVAITVPATPDRQPGPQPAPQPQPNPTPQPNPQPAPLPTTCESPFVALIGIEQQGTARAPRVQLTGVAARALAGEQVEVQRDGRRIASVQVGTAGEIEARVTAPRSRAARDRARYRLVLGAVRTSALKAKRRVVVLRRRVLADGRVVVDGRLLGVRRATTMRVTATPVCGTSGFAGRSLRSNRSGRFRVVLAPPTGDAPLLAYRIRQGTRFTSLPVLVPRG